MLKPFKSLPPRKRAFVKAYIRSGDKDESYVKAGYADSRHVANKARGLLKELAPYLAQQMTEYLKGVEMTSLGARVIVDLAKNSDSDQVKLNAAKELLMRSAPEEKTVNHVHKDLTDQEIDRRLGELQDQLFINAPVLKVVKSV